MSLKNLMRSGQLAENQPTTTICWDCANSADLLSALVSSFALLTAPGAEQSTSQGDGHRVGLESLGALFRAG